MSTRAIPLGVPHLYLLCATSSCSVDMGASFEVTMKLAAIFPLYVALTSIARKDQATTMIHPDLDKGANPLPEKWSLS